MNKAQVLQMIKKAKSTGTGFLDLSGNQLKEIPKEIGHLVNLTSLDLSQNQLAEIPKEIGHLVNLTSLHLWGNQLAEIPKEIGHLVNLTSLYLSGNRLKELPNEMGLLKNLDELNLGNLDLVSPPKSLINQGTKAIIGYYAALLKERVNTWTCKMVIVGEGKTGKSCFLDSLENKDFDATKPTTHGIDIRTLNIPHPELDGVTMKLNTWDFGGQDIYHATHQFYLTDNSIFLLVWNARQGFDAGKIPKWLETIKALAPSSPILVIATECKERAADLPKDELSELFPNIVGFFEVDNQSGLGIENSKKYIREAATGLRYMGMEQPKSWVDAEAAIKELDEKSIQKGELEQIFIDNEVGKENFESLARYLHALGEILYYPEEEELKDTIIIKPKWVSGYIARILDSDQVSMNAGFLKRDLMRELWKDIGTDLHEKFLILMENFDLSYKTRDNREISLIVEKLKLEEDIRYKERWEQKESEREIALKYKLDAIPAGIPTWFIARTHRFTTKIHWRNGVLLEDQYGKHVGLVQAFPEKKEVWLKVRGLMPHYFFSLLQDTLELTLARFKGLNVVRTIPCPGHNGEPCEHEFDLRHLEKRYEMNPPRLTIECPEAIKDVSVQKMLFGISDSTHEDLINKIEKSFERLEEQNGELIKLVHLEFLNSYKTQQSIMDVTCPNIFTLTMRDRSLFTKSLESYDAQLQLFCQQPGGWHPVEGGKYDIKIQKKWLVAVGPYYNEVIKYLKWVAPVALPIGSGLLKEADFLEFKDGMGLAEKMAGKLTPSDKEMNVDIDRLSIPKETSGAELRAIRNILEKADPAENWGGLERVVTPEGNILWLCPEHKVEYEN